MELANWSRELLRLMIDKLSERKQREVTAISKSFSGSDVVSDTELFSRMGIEVNHD